MKIAADVSLRCEAALGCPRQESIKGGRALATELLRQDACTASSQFPQIPTNEICTVQGFPNWCDQFQFHEKQTKSSSRIIQSCICLSFLSKCESCPWLLCGLFTKPTLLCSQGLQWLLPSEKCGPRVVLEPGCLEGKEILQEETLNNLNV